MDLKENQRLDDAVKLAVHGVESLHHLVEAKAMSGHESGVNARPFDQLEQAFHTQPSTGAQSCADGLFRHTDAPIEPGDMNELALAMITGRGTR